MAGEDIRFGPFIGGLNIASDPTAIADTELAVQENFELDFDGSLGSRPPIVEMGASGSWTERIVMLGVAVISGTVYLIGSTNNGVWYSINGTGAWTLITNTIAADAIVQYKDTVWIVAKPTSANPSGKWTPGGGFVAVAAMPKGSAAITHKERMYIVPGPLATADTSRLFFSDVANPDSWPASNFIDVNPGDGQSLMDLVIYADNIIVFKQDSTYVVAYDTDPALGSVKKINNTIGVSARRCVVPYENSIFLYHEGNVFEMVNADFSRVNVKVPFVYDGTAPSTRAEEIFLSRLGDRLVCRYFNKLYVYDLRTRTWSEWKSADTTLHNFGPLIGLPTNVAAAINDQYFAGSSILATAKTFRINDGYDSTAVEIVPITCRIQTKNFDLAISDRFKRLYRWGADIVSNRDVTGEVTPIVFSYQATWGSLASKTWGSLGTWGNPVTSPTVIETVVPTGSGVNRRFVRFGKALRFRQINFAVELETFGSTADGPARIFSLTATVESRQRVPKAVN